MGFKRIVHLFVILVIISFVSINAKTDNGEILKECKNWPFSDVTKTKLNHKLTLEGYRNSVPPNFKRKLLTLRCNYKVL